MNGPSPTFMASALWVLHSAGLALSLSFLLLHRPRHWLRPEAVNASGWIIICALWFIRSIALLAMRGGPPRTFGSWSDAGVSLGFLLLVDALLAIRLVSWWRYSRNDRRRL